LGKALQGISFKTNDQKKSLYSWVYTGRTQVYFDNEGLYNRSMEAIMEAIKLAFEATVITMIFIGILALLISRIKERKKR